jgi:ribonuclease E
MSDSSAGRSQPGIPGAEEPPPSGPLAPGTASREAPGDERPATQAAPSADPEGLSPPSAQGAVASPPANKPRIGDTRPAPPTPRAPGGRQNGSSGADADAEEPPSAAGDKEAPGAAAEDDGAPGGRSRGRRRGGRNRVRPAGRYQVCVHVENQVTHIAMLEGRSLVEHYVSRPADDTVQIDGNIYRGRVQNVLPGMEAAFIDIGIPKNAVLYRGDVHYDKDDIEQGASQAQPRIEDVLKPGQVILCQVTKNPIGAKGARLTQEVSLPGRFAVLVPSSNAIGISKRLGDNERRRLRRILDSVRPEGHGLIVRTAAEGATSEELGRDVASLVEQWQAIEEQAGRSQSPGLLYREPDLAVRILREELNTEYRAVIIDDYPLYEEVRGYVERVNPELADRVEYHDPEEEPLPLFERYHVHEQLHKALDRKVWLPSGGSLIIERTEALTVIDVNTGKNVGSTNLEETVFANNLEAAEEVARQLRLRDIGGIIVIDFIDMEVAENRSKVAAALRAALARDKTRTQVFDISELGLVEMTRKRVSEGLIESVSSVCQLCGGRGIIIDDTLL